MNKSQLYNNIMKTVSEQVKQSLNEVDDIQPKREIITGETYIIMCAGIDKKVTDMISSKLGKFDNYGNGAIRILCKSHEEVNKAIALLVNAGALDSEDFYLHSPKISIQKIGKTSVNDSVNEGKRTDIQRQYIQASKIKEPRQKAKFDIITKILSGELDRDPETIKDAMVETGLWNNRSEGQIQMDVNLIMRKTEPDEEMEGDFITSYTYSSDSEDAEEFGNGLAAARNHVKWLIKHGLDVTVTEKRYDYKIEIHYNTKQQYKDLVNWLAWHCGYTDTISSPVSGEDKREMEEKIASGSNRHWRD